MRWPLLTLALVPTLACSARSSREPQLSGADAMAVAEHSIGLDQDNRYDRGLTVMQHRVENGCAGVAWDDRGHEGHWVVMKAIDGRWVVVKPLDHDFSFDPLSHYDPGEPGCLGDTSRSP